jgi:NAD+ diphosphatase
MTQWIYCPECGKQMLMDGKFLACPEKHFVKYNNPVASAFVFIEYDNKFLFLKRNYDPAKGTWSVPGGFVDYDETAEEALIREVREEIGVELKDPELVYIGSFHQNYGDQNGTRNLGIAFYLKIDQPLVIDLDTDENSEFTWFAPEDDFYMGNKDTREAWAVLKQRLAR